MKVKSELWIALVIGLLPLGEDPPHGIRLYTDPESGRLLALGSAGVFEDSKECRNPVAKDVARTLKAKGFEIIYEDCIKYSPNEIPRVKK